MDNLPQIYNYTPSNSPVLASQVVQLEDAINEAARMNVLAAVDGGDYTETEVQSMVLIQALKEINGLDLAAVLLRAKKLHEIAETNAMTNHPGRYGSIREMARDQGISPTELQHTLDMVEVIFPYLNNVLGMDIATMWEELGKSNMKELIPTLKAIITGEPSGSARVNNGVEMLFDDIAASLAVQAGEDTEDFEPDTDAVRQLAVDQLLQEGQLMTNRELRNRLRPTPVPNIEPYVIPTNGGYLMVAELNEDQWSLVNRRLDHQMEAVILNNLPQDPRVRQAEVMRITPVRNLYRLMEGS